MNTDFEKYVELNFSMSPWGNRYKQFVTSDLYKFGFD